MQIKINRNINNKNFNNKNHNRISAKEIMNNCQSLINKYNKLVNIKNCQKQQKILQLQNNILRKNQNQRIRIKEKLKMKMKMKLKI
jgi:hypothetical protein